MQCRGELSAKYLKSFFDQKEHSNTNCRHQDCVDACHHTYRSKPGAVTATAFTSYFVADQPGANFTDRGTDLPDVVKRTKSLVEQARKHLKVQYADQHISYLDNKVLEPLREIEKSARWHEQTNPFYFLWAYLGPTHLFHSRQDLMSGVHEARQALHYVTEEIFHHLQGSKALSYLASAEMTLRVFDPQPALSASL